MQRRTPVGKILASIVVVIMVAIATAPIIEGAGADNNVGRHAYKVNIIGIPVTWSGSDSGSSSPTLFIGLKTVASGTNICEPTSGVTNDVAGGTALSSVPADRETIHFTTGPFAVLDRDATDGSATIQVPADISGYDVYVRVLGKPGGCLDANAYAMVNGTTYYFAGHLDANRKSGAPQKINVNDMFNVYVDTNGDGITDTQVSVFDPMFQDYFWQIQNNGLRNMQMIFYSV